MHIDVVPNRNSKPAYLLRDILRGEQPAPGDTLFGSVASPHHGHVQAVLSSMKRLGFDALLSSRPCRERDLAVAMVAARIIAPHSKLATTRWWHVTTLPEILGVCDATEDDLYDAMDWLLARQERIEKKLAAPHLWENGRGVCAPPPGLPGLGVRFRRPCRGSDDVVGAGRQGPGCLRDQEPGPGGRSGDDLPEADRPAQRRGRSGLDQRVEDRGDPGAVEKRRPADGAVRREKPVRADPPRLPRRTVDRLPESRVGQDAGRQAAGSVAGDRTGTGQGQANGGDGAHRREGQDRSPGGAGDQPIQDGQAYRPGDRRDALLLPDLAGARGRRSRPGRDLRDPHQPAQGTDERRRRRAPLQE